jgi:formylglycine-generating enzyme required for sulfatase activity
MKVIKGGRFLKGINDPESDSGEFPMQEAEVKAYYIDTHSVTNAQFWYVHGMKNLSKFGLS